ncbi:uncharacterized protein LOC130561657 isoform X1 [Triplophysa rosa]|uniref:uncharacterized protein LOC130561657 isoform X1 n=1 Tax=Triplophysa rosa TaxID=992332 RepID=UPI002545FB4F|nr:uncharacterized protein LOC130561657 isoform X1 [Triplophysa rosa]XP_057202100.1 uncharacterized protein LOC130561657 isoform X1 [Triplophysa rosa]
MLTSSPGMEAFTIKERKETNTLKTSFDHIRNMVSSAHSFRRRTPRKMPMSPASPNFSLSNPTQHCDHPDSFNKLPSRSASFSPILDKDQMDYDFQGEQDRLFCLVSQAQRGSIDKQRCSINPLSHSSRPSDQDAEQFFSLIANTQNRRLDDQRATLNLLPEIQQSTGVTGQESDQLFNIVSRIQGSRIDDQRCSAPHIQLGSPAPPRKSHSQPASQIFPPSQSGPPRRSASFSPVSENQEQNCFDQDQFFSLVHHLQQSRMDDQRCSFEPSKYSSSTIKTPNTTPIAEDAEQLFKSMAGQCALKSPPGLQTYSTEHHKGRNKASTPQITLTPASPAVPQKAPSRSTSPTLMLCDSPVRPPLRSSSPGSDEQRLLYDDMPMQITFQISMRFPPHEAYEPNIQPCQLPEVFLTVGQPGGTVVLPLNPKPGRPVSFNINPPKNQHSRSASPRRSPARQERGKIFFTKPSQCD